MDFKKAILYSKDANGSLRFWSIHVHNWELIIEYGQVDGQTQYQIISVPYGLGGRTREEQVLLQYNSRLKKKIDSGMVYDAAAALENERVNSLGFKKPMLASKFRDVLNRIKNQNLFGQPKLNGHRCLIVNNAGVLIAYSRNGKNISAIQHILEELEGRLPEGHTLDGELYCHGEKLQTISSWIKRKQPDTEKIKYYVYDCMSDGDYDLRLSEIKTITHGLENTLLCDTFRIEYDEIGEVLNRMLSEGYEGLMLRVENSEYRDGKRSKELVKVKKFFDDEFLCVDVISSAEGWGRLVLVASNGHKFKCSAPGTHEEKTKVLEEKENYIGKFVNVEYAELTKDGIPFHPTAKYWRAKSEE